MRKDKQEIVYNSHYFSNKSSGGYTLIEVIISIAVFTIGIMGVLGLSTSNYYDARHITDRNVATNLAREGIELIRNVRDSNWLKIDSNLTCAANPCTWDYGIDGTEDYVFIDYEDSVSTPVSSACVGDPVDCVGTYPETRLYINGDNYYYHDTAAPPTGTASKFFRAIRLKRICLNSDGEITAGVSDPSTFEYTTSGMGDNCDPLDSQVGIEMLSHVQWDKNGTTDYIEMVDSIYNWR